LSTAKLYRASDERRGLRIDSIQSAANPEPPLWSYTPPLWSGAYTLLRASKKLRETPQFKSFIVVRTVFALFFNGSLSQSSFMIVFIFEPFVYVGAQLQFRLEREGGVFRADLRQLRASSRGWLYMRIQAPADLGHLSARVSLHAQT